MSHISLLALLFLVLACATPQTKAPSVTSSEVSDEMINQMEPAFRSAMDREARVDRIAAPILWKNAELCGTHTRLRFGFYYLDLKIVQDMNLGTVGQKLLTRYYDLPAIRAFPVISGFDLGSPAAHSGLRVGDTITEVAGESVQPYKRERRSKTYGPPSPTSRRRTKAMLWHSNFDDLLTKYQKTDRPVSFTIRRRVASKRDTTFKIEMKAAPICTQTVTVVEGGVNAYTDGKKIVIMSDMLDFASDNELALVIAHELAHCVEGHIGKKRTNAIVGGLLGTVAQAAVDAAFGVRSYRNTLGESGVAAGASAFSQAFEQEADYVGLYLMARAGYETEGAENFWRRMAAMNPVASNSYKGSHPPTAHRYMLLAKTHDEIKRKEAEGLPLIPNR